MLAIALLLEGHGPEQAARQSGMDRQTLRDWVHRYNDEGVEVVSATTSALTSSHKSAAMSRMDLIPRGERRRRWTIEQKQMIAAESMAPEASPTDVARRHGIGTGQLYNWRRALMAAQPRAVGRFAQVELAPQPTALTDTGTTPSVPTCGLAGGATSGTAGLIEIVLRDGTTVRVDGQIDPRALRCVLVALRG
jgi:transposase